MKRFLITLHRWLGYTLGIIFAVTILTGILSGIDDLLDMLVVPNAPAVVISDREMGLALDTLTARHSDARQVLLPSENEPVFTVVLRGERYFYAASDLSLLGHEQSSRDGFFSVMLRLHRNLLMGREGIAGLSGAEWVAWVGLISLALSLLGIYLWWPHKRTFKLKRLVPTNNKQSSYYFSHLTAGIVTVAFVVLFALTGAAITYRSVAQSLLLPAQQESVVATPVYAAGGWGAAISTARQVFVDSELKSVSMSAGRRTPAHYAQAAQFRFHTPDDWFGLAGSTVYIHKQTGAYLGHQAFSDYPSGQQLYELILPLHTGRGLTPAYLIIMLAAMSLTFIMMVAGLTSFVRKKSKLEKKINQHTAAQFKKLTDGLSQATSK